MAAEMLIETYTEDKEAQEKVKADFDGKQC